MVVCKFWDAGNCRFGQNCRFEHPNTNRTQTGNRFSAFNNPSSGGGFGNGSSDNGTNTFNDQRDHRERLDDRATTMDSFCSFEEMRLHHVLAASKGSPQQALNEAQQLYQQAEQQIQTTVGNLDGQFLSV
ncbi:hypothetical protein HYQ44_015642 [Verticillium longisporum]|nr:hypothetical protein HYQ44_015642 [Verticillium longisporum]